MQFVDVREKLKSQIKDVLGYLVDRDYRLLEIPDYPNVGDVLIFQGEMDFLKTIPHRCKEMATMKSFSLRLPDIQEDELLIFSGGGYFGDLWPAGPTFQRLILEKYPNNPMLIFPQSVCFKDPVKLNDAVSRYGKHKNLSVCLRDRQSYDFFRAHFPNNAYLVPDMAFYADLDSLRGADVSCCGKLLLYRQDKEANMCPALQNLLDEGDYFVRDWPSLDRRSLVEKIKSRIKNTNAFCGKMYDWGVKNIYRKYILRSGINFIDHYEEVASTRLHGCVLALLLGKKTKAIDNSYGKVHALIDTWLANCDDIEKLV